MAAYTLSISPCTHKIKDTYIVTLQFLFVFMLALFFLPTHSGINSLTTGLANAK